MSYITNNDIELRLGTARYVQLSDDTGSGSADVNIVAELRDGAEGEVNSYLARRYAVPIDLTTHLPVSPLLKSITLDIVEYRLHARRREIPDDVVAKRTAATVWLQKVARGDVSLPSVTPIAENTATGIRATTIGNERVLSRDELADF